MEILIMLICGTLNIACFLIGAKVGQKVQRGETIELPTVNPAKLIEERREKKEQEKTQEKIDTILSNIESYDGTAFGQKDVPRG